VSSRGSHRGHGDPLIVSNARPYYQGETVAGGRTGRTTGLPL